MTKIYCDKCEQPIEKSGMGNDPDQEGEVNIKSGRHVMKISAIIERDDSQSRASREDRHSKVEDLHICFYCRLDALNQLDKRE